MKNNNKDSKYTHKIFELGAEGGSIIFYSEINEDFSETWYYYEVYDMGFEELDIPASHRISEYGFTFWESLIGLKNEKPYFYKLFPSYLDKSFSSDIIALLRLTCLEAGTRIDYQVWSEMLKMSEYDLRINVEKKR